MTTGRHARLARAMGAALLAAPVALATGNARADRFTAADRAFVTRIAQSSLFAMKAGQLAADRASQPDIRDEGVAEAHDHGLVLASLRTIVTGDGIAMPDTLPPALNQELDALNALSGTAFDDAYLGDIERAQAAYAAALAPEARAGADPRLRAFAAATLRTVRRHLGAIRAVGPGRN